MFRSVRFFPLLFLVLNAPSPAFCKNITPVIFNTTDHIISIAIYQNYIATGLSHTAHLLNDAFMKWTVAAPPRPTPVPPESMSFDQLQLSLWNAVSNGNATYVEELILAGADPTIPLFGRPVLEIAAQNLHYERFTELLGFPNKRISVIETLIRYGANPKQKNTYGITPLERYLDGILLYPNPKVVRLLDPPPRTQAKLQILLRFAVCSGDPARVETRIEQGADPTQLSFGRTFLELAAHNSHKYNITSTHEWIEVLRVLIAHGADPNQLDDGGLTALEYYARLSHPQPEIAELLGARVR